MLLDRFSFDSLVLQIRYANAYELWDRAGAISRAMCEIWPDLDLAKGQPNQQMLVSQAVTIESGIKHSTVTLNRIWNAQKNQQLKETFEAWRDILGIKEFTQVSSRVKYFREFDSLKEANAYVLGLNLVTWPTEKVFDQPMDGDKNGIDVRFRFEDSKSFSLVRIHAEQISYEVKLDPAFVPDQAEIKKLRFQAVVDFDRGVLGSIAVREFRIEDWLKGFSHVIKRDLDKVIGQGKA